MSTSKYSGKFENLSTGKDYNSYECYIIRCDGKIKRIVSPEEVAHKIMNYDALLDIAKKMLDIVNQGTLPDWDEVRKVISKAEYKSRATDNE